MARGRESRTYLNNKFDGDMMSAISVLTDEGQHEIKQLLSSKDYYVGVNGKMVFSTENDISKLVFMELSE